jgi:hypothetical protein
LQKGEFKKLILIFDEKMGSGARCMWFNEAFFCKTRKKHCFPDGLNSWYDIPEEIPLLQFSKKCVINLGYHGTILAFYPRFILGFIPYADGNTHIILIFDFAGIFWVTVKNSLLYKLPVYFTCIFTLIFNFNVILYLVFVWKSCKIFGPIRNRHNIWRNLA